MPDPAGGRDRREGGRRGDGAPTDALLNFYNGLRSELSNRVDGAAGDAKRLSLCLRDYFQRVDLEAIADGVRITPVRSAAAVERILRAVLDEQDAPWALGNGPLSDEEITTGPVGYVATGRESLVPPPLREIAAHATSPSPR